MTLRKYKFLLFLRFFWLNFLLPLYVFLFMTSTNFNFGSFNLRLDKAHPVFLIAEI